MKIEFEVNDLFLREDPDAERFLGGIQLMLNRMSVSHFKYGNMRDKYPESARAIDSADKRREMYDESGNTEDCLDAANFYVIEYVRPSHTAAHFEAQSSQQSPGLVWNEGPVNCS